MPDMTKWIQMKVNRIDIPNVSNNPTFSYCRWLIKQGADPEEYLEVYRKS